jgi:NNP family nitrate/nitrite transporter-like MFS transporter
MALGALAVMLVLPLGNFWLFLASFLVLFVAAGVGNGSTYRMIPTVFAARAGTADAHSSAGDISVQRRAAAALGLIAAIGAYGGFAIPQVLGGVKAATGSYTTAFGWFIAAYLVMMAATAFFYLRKRTLGQRV